MLAIVLVTTTAIPHRKKSQGTENKTSEFLTEAKTAILRIYKREGELRLKLLWEANGIARIRANWWKNDTISTSEFLMVNTETKEVQKLSNGTSC